MKRRTWIIGVIVIAIVSIGAFIYFYHAPLSADSLFTDEYQYVSYFYKEYPTASSAGEAILTSIEMTEILEKVQVKRVGMDKEVSSDVSCFLFNLEVAGEKDRWPLLYVFSDGRIWVDRDNGQGLSSFEVQGDQKDSLFKELYAHLLS